MHFFLTTLCLSTVCPICYCHSVSITFLKMTGFMEVYSSLAINPTATNSCSPEFELHILKLIVNQFQGFWRLIRAMTGAHIYHFIESPPSVLFFLIKDKHCSLFYVCTALFQHIKLLWNCDWTLNMIHLCPRWLGKVP